MALIERLAALLRAPPFQRRATSGHVAQAAKATRRRSPRGRPSPGPSSLADTHPRLWAALGLALIVCVAAAAFCGGALRPVDDALAQLRFRILEGPASGSLTVVEIDVPSLRAARTWPWSRERYAKAVDNLLAAGAEVVAFDVDFSARSSDEADNALAAAIARRPEAVVLPTFVQSVDQNGARRLEGTRPLAALSDSALIASVNVPVDADGKVRRYQSSYVEGKDARPSMAATLAGTPGPSSAFLIDYSIRVADIDRLSFETAYSGTFDPALVRGRKVLVGATALELGDEFVTPKGTLPGVYVHALAYESMQGGRALLEIKPAILIALAGLVAAVLRPQRQLNLSSTLRRHLLVGGAAMGLPIAIQGLWPISIDASPILLTQLLCLVWTTRTELDRRARAVAEAREAHLVQLAAHMRKSRNRIRAANAKLQAANLALDRALTAKTEFLAATSHEIRTPLNAILGMTQVILADRAVAGPLREKVNAVHGAGETMQALVSDILDVAQFETGAVAVAPVEMDLRKLLDDAAAAWSSRAASRGLAFSSEHQGVPARIVEDPVRLRQVITNLLANAVKFTEQGQVSLRAHIRFKDVEELMIEVSDTGIGIPEDQQELIFEAFQQVEGGITRKYDGAGLGLAIARQLARAMGGEVSVRSQAGRGSTFTLCLPLRRAGTDAPESSPGQATPANSLETAAVLLLDANPLFQRVTKAGLSDHVRSLDAVSSLADALATMTQREFDLLVADGQTLLRNAETAVPALSQLAAHARGARVSILWSGPGEDVPGLLAAGAHHVACKPITMAELVAQLADLCARQAGPGAPAQVIPPAA